MNFRQRYTYLCFSYNKDIFINVRTLRCSYLSWCENVFHFFLECPINEHIRNTLYIILQIYGAIDIDIILYGNENLTEAQNVDIFTAVQTIIRHSHRFD